MFGDKQRKTGVTFCGIFPGSSATPTPAKEKECMSNVTNQPTSANPPPVILPDDSLLSIRDVSMLLRSSTRTIWRMVDRKVLPEPKHHPGGRKRFFTRSTIEAYMRCMNLAIGGLTI